MWFRKSECFKGRSAEVLGVGNGLRWSDLYERSPRGPHLVRIQVIQPSTTIRSDAEDTKTVKIRNVRFWKAKCSRLLPCNFRLSLTYLLRTIGHFVVNSWSWTDHEYCRRRTGNPARMHRTLLCWIALNSKYYLEEIRSILYVSRKTWDCPSDM